MKLLAMLLVLACAHPALAETKADALFKKGKKQLAEKRYAEACATFEKVDNLDPGIGAKLNVAKCYEEWGKLARAYRWYADAEKMATDTNDKRGPKIKELIDTLSPDVPRLTIKLPDGADVLKASVTLDGETVAASAFGKEQRVDPGPHVIAYQVNGEKKTKTVPLERGGDTEVTLEIPKGKPTKVEPDPGGGGNTGKRGPPPPVVEPAPSNTRKIAAIALTGAGVLGFGIAGYLALDARSTYNDALARHCGGAKNMCDPAGNSITDASRSRANKATLIAIVGAAAVAGGVVLYVTAPKAHGDTHAMYLAPSVSHEGGGVVFGGGF